MPGASRKLPPASKKKSKKPSKKPFGELGEVEKCRVDEYDKYRAECAKKRADCTALKDCGKFGFGTDLWPIETWPLPKERIPEINAKYGKGAYWDGKRCLASTWWKEHGEKLRACGTSARSIARAAEKERAAQAAKARGLVARPGLPGLPGQPGQPGPQRQLGQPGLVPVGSPGLPKKPSKKEPSKTSKRPASKRAGTGAGTAAAAA